jgi:hypothetical protein
MEMEKLELTPVRVGEVLLLDGRTPTQAHITNGEGKFYRRWRNLFFFAFWMTFSPRFSIPD